MNVVNQTRTKIRVQLSDRPGVALVALAITVGLPGKEHRFIEIGIDTVNTNSYRVEVERGSSLTRALVLRVKPE